MIRRVRESELAAASNLRFEAGKSVTALWMSMQSSSFKLFQIPVAHRERSPGFHGLGTAARQVGDARCQTNAFRDRSIKHLGFSLLAIDLRT